MRSSARRTRRSDSAPRRAPRCPACWRSLPAASPAGSRRRGRRTFAPRRCRRQTNACRTPTDPHSCAASSCNLLGEQLAHHAVFVAKTGLADKHVDAAAGQIDVARFVEPSLWQRSNAGDLRKLRDSQRLTSATAPSPTSDCNDRQRSTSRAHASRCSSHPVRQRPRRRLYRRTAPESIADRDSREKVAPSHRPKLDRQH